jgi:hypothetical protein
MNLGLASSVREEGEKLPVRRPRGAAAAVEPSDRGAVRPERVNRDSTRELERRQRLVRADVDSTIVLTSWASSSVGARLVPVAVSACADSETAAQATRQEMRASSVFIVSSTTSLARGQMSLLRSAS